MYSIDKVLYILYIDRWMESSGELYPGAAGSFLRMKSTKEGDGTGEG